MQTQIEKNTLGVDTQESLYFLARSSIEVAEVAVSNALRISTNDSSQSKSIDWKEKLNQVNNLKRQLLNKFKPKAACLNSEPFALVENRKITDDQLYVFMISFFEDNDQLPTVDITARHFNLANNAIQQRFAKFERQGKLVRNSLGKYMFPRVK